MTIVKCKRCKKLGRMHAKGFCMICYSTLHNKNYKGFMRVKDSQFHGVNPRELGEAEKCLKVQPKGIKAPSVPRLNISKSLKEAKGRSKRK